MILTIRRASYEWALEQALNYGDTDIFPHIFEYDAIRFDWDRMAPWLEAMDVASWLVRSPRRCLTPKHRFGFRVSTQLDPLDFLIYTSLVYEIGNDLEARRVPKADQIVHSYRFQAEADGTMFDRAFGYDTCLERSRQLAGEGYSWVVVTDIADFFPRLYTHRIENSLRAGTRRENHAVALTRLIEGWNERYTYGIPVGPAASRLIAEVALDDVDRSLLSEGATFIRYSDDFRIFCRSHREAHERLAHLANVLFENHGLTLQQHKTRIVNVDDFTQSYLSSEGDREVDTVAARFYEILERLDLQRNPYEPVDWDDLTENEQAAISALNLEGILEEQLAEPEIDIPMVRFVLRRLAQLGDVDALELVLGGLDALYPVLPDVVRYVQGLRALGVAEKRDVGRRLLETLDGSTVSHLEFHRMWLLHVFTGEREWDNEDRFVALYSKWPDQFSQREVIRALGRSGQDAWFRTKKRHVFEFSPWTRRALLLGGSCLPVDERRHWYQSLEARLDPVELAISRWARQHPI